MPALVLRLDRLLRERRWVVVGVWAAVVVAAIPFAARQTENLTGNGFNVSGSQSDAVRRALNRDFAEAVRSQLAVVLVPGDGASGAALRAGVLRVGDAAARSSHVELAAAARQAALSAASRRTTLIVPLRLDVGEDGATDVATHLRDRLGLGRERDGVTTHLVGQGALTAGLQDLNKRNLETAEAAGFPIVFAILLAVFGSLAAALLPLVLGIASVAITGAVIFFLAQAMDMFVFVTNAASMIGIGVAIDYSLFIVARYREESEAGHDPDAAGSRALATSGSAVVFSGLTVIVSLGGLWLIKSDAIRSTALGAMLVVLVSVLVAITLLPALIRLLGRRVRTRGRLLARAGARLRPPRSRRSTPPFWTRWTTRVMTRPALAAFAAAAVMLTLAYPALDMRIRTGALSQFPAGSETRKGFEDAARIAGPGAFANIQVLVAFKRGGDSLSNRLTVAVLRWVIAGDPAVARTAETRSEKGRSALILATPTSDGESPAAKALVKRLRGELPALTAGRANVQVGGVSALQQDFNDQVSGSMWKLVLFVLGLSYLVLLVLLRSVILPLKAILMNLLSVGAAYGVLVVLFQWRWFGSLGLKALGDVDSLIPPFVLAIVFGLSMDYEVFLLSRIRERYEATGDNRRAVAEGLASSARTITGAAMIMAAVFLAFVATGITSTQQLGVGLAVAIALDATVVRLVLVPAMMELLGDWNWWLPRPLQRILPRASNERAPD
ncbi:MAG: putative drug exporter of the superfamily [Solirubrobacteraceae bacterium]|nr:putative drug exporter of the superfamily [Solirubrobacteraceae bacterium]